MQSKRIPETAAFLRVIRGLIPLCAILMLSPGLWARGNKEVISQTAEGSEVWQTGFDVVNHEPGTYNFIVRTRDAAGNSAQSGPFNIKIDPAAGLPTARVVYPEADSVIRQDLNLIGVAAGRFGVSRVVVQVDNQDPQTAQGTEYWGRMVNINGMAEGRHLIRVQAFDSKNLSGPEFSVSFIIDRASPQVELLSHKTGDIISGTVKFSGRLDDANGIASAAYSLDGGETYAPLGYKTRKGQTAVDFSFSVRTKSLEDGPVIYYIKTADTTGMETLKPYLFFVDNEGPQVEILSPAAADDVYGFVRVSGRVYDRVGLARFYYEWGGAAVDIPLRPGDQYWTVDLDFAGAAKTAGSFKVSAVDRSGNTSSAAVSLQDRRKVKTSTLAIDYPARQGLNALPPDGAVYGHIVPGYDAESIVIEGLAEEIPARPAFRIPPELIPPGRGTLKLYPKAAGTAVPGPALQIRTNKAPPVPNDDGTMPALNPSQITLTSPQPFAWLGTSSFVLAGSAQDGGRVEFRLGPQEDWRPLNTGANGSFRAEPSIAEIAEGPIHLELRTYTGGQPNLPFYYPLSRIGSVPDIQIISPQAELGSVHGLVTVSGLIASAVPLGEAAYSLDKTRYTPLELKSRGDRAWFSFSADFSALNRSRGSLDIRVIDASGTAHTKTVTVPFDDTADTPTLIVNAPKEGELITGDFESSGVAFDDDAIAAIYWRIVRPRSSGAQGNPAFSRIDTPQSFQIAVPFSAVADGENTMEIYAEDMYGVRSETVSRILRVSTAGPENRVISPGISDYSRHLVVIRGTASDANGIDEVQLSMDNGNTWQLANGTENWNLDLNTAAYKDGVYSLLVRTVDKFGVTAITNAMINIDNTPPVLSIGVPWNDTRIGNLLEVAGRVRDNIDLEKTSLQLVSTGSSSNKVSLDLPAGEVIMQNLDTSRLSQGEYILRINAGDRAGNTMTVSRKITIARDTTASEVALYNPMPGLDYSGPLLVSGRVTGADIPKNITLFVNGGASALMEVDRYGYFRYQYPEELLTQNAALVFAAGFDSPTGIKIVSKDHPVNFVKEGPVLLVNSHRDGDVITGRPWLSGQAWTDLEPQKAVTITRKERQSLGVEEILVSFDNGRSFERAAGRENWKFRLETGDLPLGSLPILVRANFRDGRTAIRRLVLNVDTNAPTVETLEPPEDSTHRDNIAIFGSAADDVALGPVEVSLRPGDKAGYSVPQFIQGLYVDANILGATTVDGGLGLSFFKDNVKLQVQAGHAPLTDFYTGERGRFVGFVWGVKLLANIYYLPFDYFFGPDWSFFSMSFAVGANFSHFQMDPPRRQSLFMGAILGQWEFARADLSYFFPKWKYARTIALYLEPIWWIASSDVEAEAIPRIAIGARINIF